MAGRGFTNKITPYQRLLSSLLLELVGQLPSLPFSLPVLQAELPLPGFPALAHYACS